MKEGDMVIPYLFRCPISLDLLKDPVTLCTGQTYDRSSIEKWLAGGNITCPVTMQKLHDTSMVPNHTLRHLIHQWLQTGNHLDPGFSTCIDSLAALKHTLQDPDAAEDTRAEALDKLQALCEEAPPPTNSCLLQLGFLPLLLQLVFAAAKNGMSQVNAEKALACVLHLPLHRSDQLCVVVDRSAAFLALLTRGTAFIKTGLCRMLEAMAVSSSPEVERLCAVLTTTTTLLHELVSLLHRSSEVSDAAVRTIWALSSSEFNQAALVQERAVDTLINYLSAVEREKKSSAPLALATLHRLLPLETAHQALADNPHAVATIVKMVFRVSNHEGSETAVSLLITICSKSPRAQEEAISAGVLTQLLFLLQSQCSARTKTKARTLLKLLRSHSGAHNPKHAYNNNVGCSC